MSPENPAISHRPPADYAGRAIHHGRLAATAVEKIRTLYGITDAQLAWPEPQDGYDWVGGLKSTIESQLTGLYWTDPRDEAMQHSGRCGKPANRDAIDAIGYGIAARYLDAFNLRRVIARQPKKQVPPEHKKFVRAVLPEEGLRQIHMGHLSNRAESELCAAGFTPQDAHRLHSKLLGIVINSCASCAEIKPYAQVIPEQGSATGKTPEEIDDRIDELQGHWRKQRKLLKTHVADFKNGYML